MMSKDKLGLEPAFPAVMEEEGYIANGVSKRLYIATAAMQGLIQSGWKDNETRSELIKRSYLYADELLKQENE